MCSDTDHDSDASAHTRKRTKTSVTSRQEEPAAEAHYDEDGDLEILTSDGVLYKIHAYYLQTASYVFRDMIKDSTDSRVELTDLELESQDIVGRLLNVMKGAPIYTGDVYEMVPLSKVIKLARKYACDDALTRISLQCRVDMYEQNCQPLLPFMVGIATNDMDLCRKAILQPSQAWGDCPRRMKPGFGSPFSPASLMDPTALPLELARLVKPETMWIWMRAHRNVYNVFSGDNEEKREEFSGDFVHLANLQDGGPPYTLSW